MQLTIIGTGNVATALGNAFLNAGHTIVQVYGRTKSKAQNLAKALNAEGIDDLRKLESDSAIYLFCVSDDAIEKIVKQILLKDIFCVHTSGAISLTVLQNKFESCGVIYPLQTISTKRKINFKEVPFCIEASDKRSEKRIRELVLSISENMHSINSEQRLYLHLAAVLANNFTNNLYAKAAELLQDQNLKFELLHPLILETALKATEIDPHKVQTGPAVRNDQVTIKKHLQLLEFYPDLKKIYQLMTKQIQQS